MSWQSFISLWPKCFFWGSKDPPGTARLTDAYCLPSKFVAHTCGPRVTNFMQALPAQDLESCYRSVLEACAEKEDIRSVAFCCVSTGLFGYSSTRLFFLQPKSKMVCVPSRANTPKAFGDCSFWLRYPNEPAAQLAIEVVSSFLQQSPDALDFIIFDTFLPKDYVVYRKLLDATLDSHWTRKVDMEGWHCGLLNPDYSKSTGRQLTNIMCVYGQRIFLI